MTLKKIKLSSDIAMLSDIVESKGVGIPILDNELVRELSSRGKLPDDYIYVPDADQESVLAARSGEQTAGGVDRSYLDILFESIRALQSEVSRLRNTMRYGMQSYTESKTAMSNVVNDGATPQENEPMWAIEESDLAAVQCVQVSIGPGHCLVPRESVYSAEDGMLSVHPLSSAAWIDNANASNNCRALTDSKIFLYLTTSCMNTTLSVRNVLDDSRIQIDLNRLGVAEVSPQKYNVLVAVSRSFKRTYDTRYYGKNFIWMSVVDYGTLNRRTEGYWNTETSALQKNVFELSSAARPELSSNRYYIEGVGFYDRQRIYKFDMYTKYQDFSTEVAPNTPVDDSEFKYQVAHITIRSVSSIDVLKSIVKQLQVNELIYNSADSCLYIVNEKGKYKKISGGGSQPEEEGMTKEEILEWLGKNGIHVTLSGGEPVSIDDLRLGQVTFINEDTRDMFRFTCTPEGALKSQKIPDTTLSARAAACGLSAAQLISNKIRGFAGNLMCLEGGRGINDTSNAKSMADRVKIGAIYAPNVENGKHYGCSHAYVELENTSDVDFQLAGCYLFYGKECGGTKSMLSVALDGVLPAHGTYLIRGKQYCDFDDSNCFIKVREFDKEWFSSTSSLVDLTIDANDKYTFLLTYGVQNGFNYDTTVVEDRPAGETETEKDLYKVNPYVIGERLIDIVSINGHTPWAKRSSFKKFAKQSFDCIYKNVFELDPAMQAFQGLCGKKDSSRQRNTTASDYQYLDLSRQYIEFPKTPDKYDVGMFTPRASYENKNVSTDKTKLDAQRPNMPTCSFGINMHRTRCFNWVSTGRFDEYVWIRKKTDGEPDGEWESRVESYKAQTAQAFPDTFLSGFQKVEFPDDILSAVYARDIYVHGKSYSVFPGCGVAYTAHKCIITLSGSIPGSPETYEYVVGRADKNGAPDKDHVSDVQTFTMYPTDYKPKIFQITDQQGFHWIEYQAWAAAAQELDKTIRKQSSEECIIPVLINTGDMTQNGTRINEWLDYYNAGKCLFSHLEQMNVVGNNDLCDADPSILGTGDDIGKSNSFYFHMLYCYEIPNGTQSQCGRFKPIYNGVYIPSLYFFETDEHSSVRLRMVMVNSEITVKTCEQWYYRPAEDETEQPRPVNVYTGWQIKKVENDPGDDLTYDKDHVHVYEMLYDVLKDASDNDENTVVVCHEMPFTVITHDNIAKNDQSSSFSVSNTDRSVSGSDLVGSHLNRMSAQDVKSNYWFSRLLEHFKVRLCLGGHKHTYACTYPVRELYQYEDADGKVSCSLYGAMQMPENLSGDTAQQAGMYCVLCATFGDTGASRVYRLSDGPVHSDLSSVNSSKFPLIHSDYKSGSDLSSGISVLVGTAVYPYYEYNNSQFSDDYRGVTYFMLQATGYKLKSSKELPSTNQEFAYLLPKTVIEPDNQPTAAGAQQYPMFAEIELGDTTYDIYLARLSGILNDSDHTFTQQSYGKGLSCRCQYLKQTFYDAKNAGKYGVWQDEKRTAAQVPGFKSDV